MGNRSAYLKNAVDFLRTLGTIERISSIYETEPVGMSPETHAFLNMAVGLKSLRSPHDLLNAIKAFEKEMGRDLTRSHNHPRTIDIDILLADDRIIATEHLTIPHPEMEKRAFVLVPLNEIAPHALHPILKKTIRELHEALPLTVESVLKISDDQNR